MKMNAIRLREGEKLKESIEKFVQENNLTAATVISAVGSLSHATPAWLAHRLTNKTSVITTDRSRSFR